jgi:hypothetical protein
MHDDPPCSCCWPVPPPGAARPTSYALLVAAQLGEWQLTGERKGLNALHSLARFGCVLDPHPGFVVDFCVSFSRERNMKKVIIVGLAIFAVSTSAALAKSHAKKPKAPAAATSPAGPIPLMGQVSAADQELYKKNKRASGMK